MSLDPVQRPEGPMMSLGLHTTGGAATGSGGVHGAPSGALAALHGVGRPGIVGASRPTRGAGWELEQVGQVMTGRCDGSIRSWVRGWCTSGFWLAGAQRQWRRGQAGPNLRADGGHWFEAPRSAWTAPVDGLARHRGTCL